VVFYLYMKAQGQSVRSHPVMRQLLELRSVRQALALNQVWLIRCSHYF
jgi:hypothetical protein